jgi:hypothetical protein
MGYENREDPPDTKWCALVHRTTKWISIGKSYAMAPDGTGYGKWDLISDQFTEQEANRYVRMNWKDRLFTPYEQAQENRTRGLVPYCKMDDEEFEALFYRMSLEEFMEAQKPEIEKEAREKAEKEAEFAEDMRLRKLDCKGFKVLYLYGYGNSSQLVEANQLKGLKQMLPNAQIETLEGFIRLTKRKSYANSEDNNPNLVRMGLHEGVALYCYAEIECPPEDPGDFTAHKCEAQGVMFAKAKKKDMEWAVKKTAQHIIDNGGYDLICGFSCGGEVVAQLIGKLSEINEKVARPTRAVAMFGTRCLYGKYGAPLDGPIPHGLKVGLVFGDMDDEERPDFTEDNLWDMNEFHSKFEAAGIDSKRFVFGGKHEMPEYQPVSDPVHLPLKRYIEELLPLPEEDADVVGAVSDAMAEA